VSRNRAPARTLGAPEDAAAGIASRSDCIDRGVSRSEGARMGSRRRPSGHRPSHAVRPRGTDGRPSPDRRSSDPRHPPRAATRNRQESGCPPIINATSPKLRKFLEFLPSPFFVAPITCFLEVLARVVNIDQSAGDESYGANHQPPRRQRPRLPDPRGRHRRPGRRRQ